MRKRITGLASGAIDLEAKEVQFDLGAGPELIPCVAKPGVLDQVIGALGSLRVQLRDHLISQGAKVQTSSAEKIVSAHIQRERLHDVVLVQLVSDTKVPYTFAIPLDDAADIGRRLIEQSSREITAGQA